MWLSNSLKERQLPVHDACGADPRTETAALQPNRGKPEDTRENEIARGQQVAWDLSMQVNMGEKLHLPEQNIIQKQKHHGACVWKAKGTSSCQKCQPRSIKHFVSESMLVRTKPRTHRIGWWGPGAEEDAMFGRDEKLPLKEENQMGSPSKWQMKPQKQRNKIRCNTPCNEKLPLEENNRKQNMKVQPPGEINDEALESQRKRGWRLRFLREKREMERKVLTKIEMEEGMSCQMFEGSLKGRYMEREKAMLRDLPPRIQRIRERQRHLDQEMDIAMEIERLSATESSKLGEREWDSEWEWESEFESQTMMSDNRLPLHRLYSKTSSRLKHLQKQDMILDLIRQQHVKVESRAEQDIRQPLVKIDGDAVAGRNESLAEQQSKKKAKRKKRRMKNKKKKKVEWIMENMDAQPDLTLEKKAMQALHLVNFRKSVERDPRKKALVPTRVSKFNITFFDMDEESKPFRWPLFRDLPLHGRKYLAGSSLNVISLKVVESCVGYPIEVYGTVLARDSIDFKCVYLFRRGRDDPQKISSKDDMLTLTGPHRGFVVTDYMFFEINLKIKNAPQLPDEDFSKGVLGYNGCVVDKRPIARVLTSWWSKVELVYRPLEYPAEATIAVKILKGHAPFKGKIIALVDGNESNNKNQVILYDSTARGTWAEVEGSDEDGVSVALSRNLVAVPVLEKYKVDCKMELSVCFDTDGKLEVATLRYPVEEKVCKVGSYELQVKVTWRAILGGASNKELTEVFNSKRWQSLPINSYKSWLGTF